MSRIPRLLFLALACAAMSLGTPAQSPAAPDAQSPASPHAQASDPSGAPTTDPEPSRSAPWSARVMDLAERLPVQDGGRIKPLSTFAAFTLLRLNGVRSVTTPKGEKLTPTAWLLDTLFFPADAAEYPCFVVQNSEAVEAIGLDLKDKKKRDHYSFDELRPGISKLLSLAHEYGSIEEKERTAVQSQVVNLAENVLTFARLAQHLDFAHARIPASSDPAFERLFPGRVELRFHELLASVPELRKDADMAERLKQLAGSMGSSTGTLVLFPPVDQRAEWQTPAEVLSVGLQDGTVPAAHVALVQSLETLDDVRGDPPAFERELERLSTNSWALASARGETAKIDLEVSYYHLQPLTWSLSLFVLAFLCATVLWLRPKSRALYSLTSGAAFLATLFVVLAIVMRCMIRSRPPVSTLYETVLFVTSVGASVALITEWIQRQRIAVSAAAIVGMVGLFIANGYETLDKKDTMPSLVAVLDTNFWLATHVTCVTIGYSAGMLAALLGSLYLLAKLLGWKKGEPAFYRGLGRTVYGVLCFGVIFATVGTILGGIWANESWGRFWGWDPKENGALLIVLTQLGILHSRMGGYLREHGVCMAAAFGGTVVAFSWWGVNLLGVGLHSYGFTSGIHTALWTYYAIQWGIVLLGGYTWLRERALARAAVALPVAPEPRAPRPEGPSHPPHGAPAGM